MSSHKTTLTQHARRAAFLIFGSFCSVVALAQAPLVKTLIHTEEFQNFNANAWSCEYSCPTVVNGVAQFNLAAGVAPDNYGSWSKARYGAKRFTSGSFKVRFALSHRPAQAVWWGVALWDDGPAADGSKFNEINFGYTTNQSFTNTQLYFESAKLGKALSVKIDTKVNLYDGKFHEAELEYDAKHVSFYLDGVLMHTITDTSVIPTDPMDFILGPRVVTGSYALSKDFTQYIDWAKIYDVPAATVPPSTGWSPPLVHFTKPGRSATLSGETHVNAFANDPDIGMAANGSGIASVKFELTSGGRTLASRVEYQTPYDWYLNTRNHPNGYYTLRATATATAAAGGGVKVVEVPVKLSN